MSLAVLNVGTLKGGVACFPLYGVSDLSRQSIPPSLTALEREPINGICSPDLKM